MDPGRDLDSTNTSDWSQTNDDDDDDDDDYDDDDDDNNQIRLSQCNSFFEDSVYKERFERSKKDNECMKKQMELKFEEEKEELESSKRTLEKKVVIIIIINVVIPFRQSSWIAVLPSSIAYVAVLLKCIKWNHQKETIIIMLLL